MSNLFDQYTEALIDQAMDNDEMINEANYRTMLYFTDRTGLEITEQDQDNWNWKDWGSMWEYSPEELVEKILELRKNQ